jgi:hypothetical protein
MRLKLLMGDIENYEKLFQQFFDVETYEGISVLSFESCKYINCMIIILSQL